MGGEKREQLYHGSAKECTWKTGKTDMNNPTMNREQEQPGTNMGDTGERIN